MRTVPAHLDFSRPLVPIGGENPASHGDSVHLTFNFSAASGWEVASIEATFFPCDGPDKSPKSGLRPLFLAQYQRFLSAIRTFVGVVMLIIPNLHIRQLSRHHRPLRFVQAATVMVGGQDVGQRVLRSGVPKRPPWPIWATII